MLHFNSKILIVDDFDSARQLILRALSALGYVSLSEAENGRKAFQMIEASVAENRPFDLIFADVNMPEMDGMELLLKCKELEKIKEIPIVMITAETEAQVITKALKAGAFDYIKKPVSLSGLEKKIKSISERLKKPSAA